MPDERHVANLLVRLIDSLGRPAANDLVDECDAAVIACLAITRESADEPEPEAPTTDELEQLAKRIVHAPPGERTVVLREIRNALGRLDIHRAVG